MSQNRADFQTCFAGLSEGIIFFFFMQAFREMRMGFFTPFYLSIKFILNFEVNLMQGRAKL